MVAQVQTSQSAPAKTSMPADAAVQKVSEMLEQFQTKALDYLDRISPQPGAAGDWAGPEVDVGGALGAGGARRSSSFSSPPPPPSVLPPNNGGSSSSSSSGAIYARREKKNGEYEKFKEPSFDAAGFTVAKSGSAYNFIEKLTSPVQGYNQSLREMESHDGGCGKWRTGACAAVRRLMSRIHDADDAISHFQQQMMASTQLKGAEKLDEAHAACNVQRETSGKPPITLSNYIDTLIKSYKNDGYDFHSEYMACVAARASFRDTS